MSQILSLVGAGLTKALARPPHPVPAMFDFVSTCAEYIDDEVILTTLTQLETYRPYPYVWHSLAAERLASALIQQKRRHGTTGDGVRKEFAQALRERPSESIEVLLDRADGNNENASPKRRGRTFSICDPKNLYPHRVGRRVVSLRLVLDAPISP